VGLPSGNRTAAPSLHKPKKTDNLEINNKKYNLCGWQKESGKRTTDETRRSCENSFLCVLEKLCYYV